MDPKFLIIDDCVGDTPWGRLLKLPNDKFTKQQVKELESYHIFIHGRHGLIRRCSSGMLCNETCEFREKLRALRTLNSKLED